MENSINKLRAAALIAPAVMRECIGRINQF